MTSIYLKSKDSRMEVVDIRDDIKGTPQNVRAKVAWSFTLPKCLREKTNCQF